MGRPPSSYGASGSLHKTPPPLPGSPTLGSPAKMSAEAAANEQRHEFVEEVVRRLGMLHQVLDYDDTYKLVKRLEKKSLKETLKQAVAVGADLDDVIRRFQDPSAFPLSIPFPNGREFTQQQAIIALVLSLSNDDLSTSPEQELRKELSNLTLGQLRFRAVAANGGTDDICNAIGDPTIGKVKEKYLLSEIIVDGELMGVCKWRQCRRSRKYRERPPKNYAELAAIDSHQLHARNDGFLKSQGKAPPHWARNTPLQDSAEYQVLASYSATVLPWAFNDIRYWFSMVVYLATRFSARQGYGQNGELPQIDSGSAGTVGGFLTFFLVFYAGQAYSRYNDQYAAAMKCKCKLIDICSFARTCMTGPSGQRLWRHLNTAHILCFVGLSETFTVDNFVRPLSTKHALLSDAELTRIMELNPDTSGDTPKNAMREVIVWALQDVVTEMQRPAEGKIVPAPNLPVYALFQQINELRDQLQQLYDFKQQPVPFFYVHMLHVLVSVYIPLFGYNVATRGNFDEKQLCGGSTFEQEFVCTGGASGEVVAIFLLTLYFVLVLGLSQAGQQLSDPFGIDLVDMPVRNFVVFALEATKNIMEAQPDMSVPHDNEGLQMRAKHRWKQGKGMAGLSKKLSKMSTDARVKSKKDVSNGDKQKQEKKKKKDKKKDGVDMMLEDLLASDDSTSEEEPEEEELGGVLEYEGTTLEGAAVVAANTEADGVESDTSSP